MLEVFDRGEIKRYLDAQEIEKITCQDLITIDQLWLKYSQGHFGFSVQRRLWKNIENENPGISDTDIESLFGKRVAWNVNNRWLSYPEHKFTLKAAEGHLPKNFFQNYDNQNSYLFGSYTPLRVRLYDLFLRLDICQSSNNVTKKTISTRSLQRP